MDDSTEQSEPACNERSDEEGASALDLSGDVDCGLETFDADCATCHGPTGEGTAAGPELAEHIVAHTDAQLVLVMAVGTGDMPAQELSPQQTADVLAWLRDTFGPYNGKGH